MNRLDELLTRLAPFSTVILAGTMEARRRVLLQRLDAAGVNVIGPVDRASLALALAAQSPMDLAIIESELAGRRDGRELAEALERDWGITSIVIDASRRASDGRAGGPRSSDV